MINSEIVSLNVTQLKESDNDNFWINLDLKNSV